jgi:K+-sensing histidine kinase KdpD
MKQMKPWQRRMESLLIAVWPTALAVWLLLLATWVKLRLPVLGQDTPFLMYFFIIAVGALASGWRLGLAITLLAAACAHVFFLEAGHWANVSIGDLLKLILFTLEGSLLVFLVERERRSKRRHQVSIRELEATRQTLAASNERITNLLEEVMDKSSPGSVRHHRRS